MMPVRLARTVFILLMAVLGGYACGNRAVSLSDNELNAFFDKVDSLNDKNGSRGEIAYIDSVYGTLPAIDDHMLLIKYLRGVTNRFSWGETEASLRYSDSAIAIVKKYADEPSWNEDYVRAYTSRGSVYFGTGRTDEALECYFLARERSRLLTCGSAAYPDHYIGLALYKQKKYANACEFFKNALGIIDRCPQELKERTNQKIELLNNISLCYRNLRDFASAKGYIRTALVFLDHARKYRLFEGDEKIIEQHYTVKHAVIRANLGKLYELEGMTDSAEFLYKESILLTRLYHKEHAFVQATQADLARLYLAKHLPEKAGAVLSAMRTGLDTLPNAEAELAWLDLESQHFEQAGAAQQALQVKRRYYDLRDSLDKELRENTLSSLTDGLRRKSQGLEISLLKKTNAITRIYLLIAVMLVTFASITLYMVMRNSRRTKRNLQHLRKLNEQIGRQKNELEQANRDKERLMQVVAHDLRNPVGMTSYVIENLLLNERFEEQSEKSLNRVRKAMANALVIIDDLLGMQREDSSVLKAEQVELSGIVASEIELLSHKAKEKDIEITYLSKVSLLHVKANANQLSRVFSNLIANAIKFTPKGSSIGIEVLRENNNAQVVINDRGIGMPSSMLEKNTNTLVTVRQTGTAGEQSFGMGLEIAKAILEAYGGKLCFEGRLGGGTRIIVTLPLSAPNAE